MELEDIIETVTKANVFRQGKQFKFNFLILN